MKIEFGPLTFKTGIGCAKLKNAGEKVSFPQSRKFLEPKGA